MSNELVAKGITTAYSLNFISELLDIMDMGLSMKEHHFVLDNLSIRKYKSIIRKIESRGYSPESNPIEQFGLLLKAK